MEDDFFDRFLISIFDKNESNLNLNSSIIILSYCFELTDLIIQGVNQEKENETNFFNYLNNLYSNLNLLSQKIISFTQDKNIGLFFLVNPYENIFEELNNKLDLKSVIETIYNGFLFVLGKRKLVPTYLQNYYEEMIEKSFEKQLNEISEIEPFYLKYFTKLKIYVFYILIFLDNLLKDNLETMFNNAFSDFHSKLGSTYENFNQISKFITDAKNKWFNMFKLSFKDVNNENQANEIIDKSYYNLSISMNKVLNLEEEVICDFEIPYFYDVNII